MNSTTKTIVAFIVSSLIQNAQEFCANRSFVSMNQVLINAVIAEVESSGKADREFVRFGD